MGMMGYTEGDIDAMLNILHDSIIRLHESKVDNFLHYDDELRKVKTFLSGLVAEGYFD